MPVLVGEVRAAEERLAVRSQEDRHGPASVPGHGLDRLHVHGVEVRALLAVHLHRHEVLVHDRGSLGILEGLPLHDVAPVARRVPDREQDGTVLAAGLLQGLVPPRVPVHRVVGVLQEVGTGLVGQPVGAAFDRFCHSASFSPEPARWHIAAGGLSRMTRGKSARLPDGRGRTVGYGLHRIRPCPQPGSARAWDEGRAFRVLCPAGQPLAGGPAMAVWEWRTDRPTRRGWQGLVSRDERPRLVPRG